VRDQVPKKHRSQNNAVGRSLFSNCVMGCVYQETQCMEFCDIKARRCRKRNICAAGKQPVGELCNRGEDCSSGVCVNEVCESGPLGVFKACDNDSDCDTATCFATNASARVSAKRGIGAIGIRTASRRFVIRKGAAPRSAASANGARTMAYAAPKFASKAFAETDGVETMKAAGRIRTVRAVCVGTANAGWVIERTADRAAKDKTARAEFVGRRSVGPKGARTGYPVELIWIANLEFA